MSFLIYINAYKNSPESHIRTQHELIAELQKQIDPNPVIITDSHADLLRFKKYFPDILAYFITGTEDSSDFDSSKYGGINYNKFYWVELDRFNEQSNYDSTVKSYITVFEKIIDKHSPTGAVFWTERMAFRSLAVNLFDIVMKSHKLPCFFPYKMGFRNLTGINDDIQIRQYQLESKIDVIL